MAVKNNREGKTRKRGRFAVPNNPPKSKLAIHVQSFAPHYEARLRTNGMIMVFVPQPGAERLVLCIPPKEK